ncbi:hypothetical protein CBS101457_001619 [Exobasidium rhododendri]|nr:hypothetical protein CBS101457_001619 [Exobasidium rhododendri]
MDLESFRKAGHEAIDSICDYYQTLSQRPVMAQVEPGFLGQLIPDHAPEHGEEWSSIAKDYQEIILPGITHWQHPNFYAYFPAIATFEGFLADLHSAAISHPGFNWSTSPSNTELELITLDWMARMFGLSSSFLNTSERGGGIILGTASEVAITVAVAARERALAAIESEEGLQHADTVFTPEAGTAAASNIDNTEKDMSLLKMTAARWRGTTTAKLVMYGTTQTHSIGAKAAIVLGLSFRAIEVFAKDDYALRGDQLESALNEDIAKGLIPFMLIATVGTTSSGAVDNLREIQGVAKRYPYLWVHVDAAWAGVAFALPEYRHFGHLDALNAFVDSFSTNMHKWGLVQFDCAPLWVRNRADLSNALTLTPEFLRTKQGDAGSVLDLRNMQLFLGRRFRSLKVWFVLRSFGQEGFRQHLRSSLARSQEFNDLIRTGPTPLEIVTPPSLSLTVFRLHPHNDAIPSKPFTSTELDHLNQKFWLQMQSMNHRFLLTQTVLPEIGFCFRLAVGNPRTKVENIKETYEAICECAQALL